MGRWWRTPKCARDFKTGTPQSVATFVFFSGSICRCSLRNYSLMLKQYGAVWSRQVRDDRRMRACLEENPRRCSKKPTAGFFRLIIVQRRTGRRSPKTVAPSLRPSLFMQCPGAASPAPVCHPCSAKPDLVLKLAEARLSSAGRPSVS